MPKLDVTLSTELRQTGTSNGFELFRQILRKLDPPMSDPTFHLENELRALSGTPVAKDFPQTVRFVHFLESKIKDYLMETGEIFSNEDACRVLSKVVDEDTVGRLEDAHISLRNYQACKGWIIEREREPAETSQGHEDQASQGLR